MILKLIVECDTDADKFHYEGFKELAKLAALAEFTHTVDVIEDRRECDPLKDIEDFELPDPEDYGITDDDEAA